MIAVNTTYQLAPWADALFAMDLDWWQTHVHDVDQVFQGTRYSNNPLSERYHCQHIADLMFKTFGNSGAAAINVAAGGGAARVILLGYDCQKTGGKSHWHGDHPQGLKNVVGINLWPQRFAELGASLSGVQVVNCSRKTALTCFERMPLDVALAT